MLLIAVHWPDKVSETWTKQIHVNRPALCKDWSANVFHVYSMSGSKTWDIIKLYERELRYDIIRGCERDVEAYLHSGSRYISHTLLSAR